MQCRYSTIEEGNKRFQFDNSKEFVNEQHFAIQNTSRGVAMYQK